MQLQVTINEQTYTFDTSKAVSISIPVNFGPEQLNAFYIDPASKKPYQAGSFVGNVLLGGACNVDVIQITPHGNGTHTECVGHISKEPYNLHECVRDLFCVATLVTIAPEKNKEDLVITKQQIESKNIDTPGIIVRTTPNGKDKLTRNYSGNNPPYFQPEALKFLAGKNVIHLITDLPSVDREDDGGVLASHHHFWNYPSAPRTEAAITELVYVPDEIADGKYLVQFSFSPMQSDAAPSLVLLYPLS